MTAHKDKTIQRLLQDLAIEERGWIVVDHWHSDLCAIGIAAKGHPRKLVYVSTYGKPEGLYDYECESPRGLAIDEYQIASTAQDVTLQELLVAMQLHLNDICSQ